MGAVERRCGAAGRGDPGGGVAIAALLTLAAALAVILLIRAQMGGQRRQVYIAKPLATILLLATALLVRSPVSQTYQLLIAGGLLCSLAGDVCLMLPQEQAGFDWFLAGMVSFFAAHLLYIAAFVTRNGWNAEPFLLLLWVSFGIGYTALLWPYLGRLRLPVLAYIGAILLMAWQAIGGWQRAPSSGTAAAALGAISFVLSDSALAWDRFRRRFTAAPVVVLGSYYLAQGLLAWSVAG
ncbi:MAG TPA: lysoplasmalogenase [Caldilineaceae bacterium]|nr:lysoplasmalogenase [Caldilineaceae bacterium]